MGFEYAKEEYGIVCPKVHLLKSEHDEMDVLSESEQQDLMNHLLKNTDYVTIAAADVLPEEKLLDALPAELSLPAFLNVLE